MSDEDLMTYSKLRKIQKEENRKDELVELEDNFLISLSNYLETKKKHSDDDREYKNAKRVFEKIISIREDKITQKAKIAAKTNTPIDLDLLPEEQELFRELKTRFEEHSKRLENKIETGSSKNRETNKKQETKKKTVEEESESQEEKEKQEKELENDTEDNDYVKIKIKENVPEFMGTDLETYGPFEEGDEAQVPKENAEILINRGNAEEKA